MIEYIKLLLLFVALVHAQVQIQEVNSEQLMKITLNADSWILANSFNTQLINSVSNPTTKKAILSGPGPWVLGVKASSTTGFAAQVTLQDTIYTKTGLDTLWKMTSQDPTGSAWLQHTFDDSNWKSATSPSSCGEFSSFDDLSGQKVLPSWDGPCGESSKQVWFRVVVNRLPDSLAMPDPTQTFAETTSIPTAVSPQIQYSGAQTISTGLVVAFFLILL